MPVYSRKQSAYESATAGNCDTKEVMIRKYTWLLFNMLRPTSFFGFLSRGVGQMAFYSPDPSSTPD